MYGGFCGVIYTEVGKNDTFLRRGGELVIGLSLSSLRDVYMPEPAGHLHFTTLTPIFTLSANQQL